MRDGEINEVPRRPLAQRLGAILWPSFLLSGLTTLIAAGLFAPEDLHALGFPDWNMSGGGTFSLLFFILWAITAGSSFMTWVLLRSAERLNVEQPDHTDSDI